MIALTRHPRDEGDCSSTLLVDQSLKRLISDPGGNEGVLMKRTILAGVVAAGGAAVAAWVIAPLLDIWGRELARQSGTHRHDLAGADDHAENSAAATTASDAPVGTLMR